MNDLLAQFINEWKPFVGRRATIEPREPMPGFSRGVVDVVELAGNGLVRVRWVSATLPAMPPGETFVLDDVHVGDFRPCEAAPCE